MLTLQNIGKIYTKEGNVNKALSGVNLNFEIGEFVAITGKSGSGKSTLLSIISGLESYEEGEMYLNGKPTSHYKKEDWNSYNASQISCIFQDYNILESFTVLENVEFALTNIKDIKERRERAIEIVKKVGLFDRVNTRGSKLSGGEKQRTVIARAVAKDSPIILADEPTGNLDSKTAREVLELIKEISKGKLVIVVTHNYEDVQEFATRHIRLHDGKVELDEYINGNVKSEKAKKSRDKYDFSDAREHIFRRNVKGNEKSDKPQYLDAILLGSKRYVTRPKHSILMTLLLTISLVLLLIVLSYKPFNLAGGTYSKINDLDGRVIVANSNGSQFTRATAEELKESAGAENYIFSDLYLDVPFQLLHEEVDRYMDDTVFKISPDNSSKIVKGKNPNADFEIAIKVPYSYMNKYELNEYIYLSMSDNNSENGYLRYKVKLVGIDYYVANVSKTPIIYMTKHFYENIARINRNIEAEKFWFEKYRKLFPDENSTSTESNKYSNNQVIVDGNLKDNEFYYNSMESVDDSYKVAIEYGDYTLHDLKKVATPEDTYDRGISISFDILNGFLNEKSSQISLIFEDKTKLDSFLAKEDALEKVVVSQFVSEKNSNDISQIIARLLQTSLIILLLVTVIMIMVVAMQRLLYSTKSDIAIFRTMGIHEKTIKRSTYVQLILALLPAYLIVLVVALLLYFTPMGYAFTMLDAFGGIVIFVGSLIMTWAVALSYNKVMYHEKINKSLRRVNK